LAEVKSISSISNSLEINFAGIMPSFFIPIIISYFLLFSLFLRQLF
jgi:hypothetical protein